MTKYLNLEGKRFNNWLVLKHVPGPKNTSYLCKCLCGSEGVVQAVQLVKEQSKSCGCLRTELSKKTFLNNYGVDNPQKSKKIRARTEETCLIKYGCTNPVNNESVREKTKQTCLERYGVEHFVQTQEFKDKVDATYTERCGSPNKRPDETRIKREKTMMERYGVHHMAVLPSVREGYKRTCLAKYGVDHSSKVPEILNKITKSRRRSTVLTHWKTGKELVCVASYEVKVVEYLNKNKIEFEWQIPFTMPDGRIYFCDAYFPEWDKYVEIKGYFINNINKEKWNWFHSTHSNSELWNREKLRSMELDIK